MRCPRLRLVRAARAVCLPPLKALEQTDEQEKKKVLYVAAINGGVLF